MSLQKASGTNIDNTVTPANAATLVDHLETHLVNAGWTIVSGAGTDAIKFQSASTPDSMQVRIVTSVIGSEMGLEIRNPSESVSGATANIRLDVDGIATWRLMANQFAFVLFEDTAAVGFDTAGGKKWCMAGTLFLESFLTPTITEIGFLFGDHRSTGVDTHYRSFRIAPEITGRSGNFSLLYNGLIQDSNDQANTAIEEGQPGMVVPTWPKAGFGLYSGSPTLRHQWKSGEHFMADPLVSWGDNRTTDFKQIRGQFFDVIIALDDNLSVNDSVVIGSDTFRVISDAPAATDTVIPYAMLWLKP